MLWLLMTAPCREIPQIPGLSSGQASQHEAARLEADPGPNQCLAPRCPAPAAAQPRPGSCWHAGHVMGSRKCSIVLTIWLKIKVHRTVKINVENVKTLLTRWLLDWCKSLSPLTPRPGGSHRSRPRPPRPAPAPWCAARAAAPGEPRERCVCTLI